MTDVATHARIKQIIIEQLNLDGMSDDDIGDGDPLFGEGLGLDSVDALELVVALEKEPRDPAARRSWLAGIVRNLALRARKREAVRARHAPSPRRSSSSASVSSV